MIKGVVPPNLHFSKLNGLIDSQTQRMAVLPSTVTPLLPMQPGKPIYVGVSSFGSGGTNGHVILQSVDYNHHLSLCSVSPKAHGISTPNKTNTNELSTIGIEAPQDVVFLFTGQGANYFSFKPDETFVSSQQHLGRPLFQAEAAYRDTFQRCSTALSRLKPSLVEVMYGGVSIPVPPGKSVEVEGVVYAHCGLFALQVSLAALWKSRGFNAAAVCGN
jgi:acyl transferase domain-containing protein